MFSSSLTITTKILLGLMVVAIASIAVLNGYVVYHANQEPLILSNAKVVNNPVKLGAPVIIEYDSDRRFLCKTDVDIFAFRKALDTVLVSAARVPAGINGLGVHQARVSVPMNLLIPKENLTVGKYILRFFVHNDCGDRLHTLAAPDVEFEAIE